MRKKSIGYEPQNSCMGACTIAVMGARCTQKRSGMIFYCLVRYTRIVIGSVYNVKE